VSLYELGQNDAADHCFRASLRLNTAYAEAEGNRKQVQRRKKQGSFQLPFAAATIAQVEILARQATPLADRTQLPSADQVKLSLVMIVKNEESALPECLESVKGLVDEMIIVDTGSTDRTVEIAEQYGAQVIDFPWTGSFSEARNVSLEHATGDWVLMLDADERLLPEQHAAIRSKLAESYREGFVFVEYNYTGVSSAESAIMQHATMRLWRHRPEYCFAGVIHEQKNNSKMICKKNNPDNTGLPPDQENIKFSLFAVSSVMQRTLRFSLALHNDLTRTLRILFRRYCRPP
jgi:glycosyltransferase involved in cell wall biosynthesis